MTDSSYVQTSDGGTVAFVGRDATELFRVTTLRAALRLAKVGIKATRGLTGTKALNMCKPYTGKAYKRGRYDEAIADLTVWIETMKSALPVVRS